MVLEAQTLCVWCDLEMLSWTELLHGSGALLLPFGSCYPHVVLVSHLQIRVSIPRSGMDEAGLNVAEGGEGERERELIV